jgi:RHS repeat-associated protein
LTNNGTTTTTKKYYAIAGQTVAMDDGSGLKYLLADHLGSTVGVTDSDGELISQQRYLPFGEIRNVGVSITQTDFGYTGQRNLPDTGLMDYKTRMYDPYLNRWTQPDTIIPDQYNPQDWNRYSYVRNNPINFIDPSGHRITCGDGEAGGCGGDTLDYLSWAQNNNSIDEPEYLKRAGKVVTKLAKELNYLIAAKNKQLYSIGYQGALPDALNNTLISRGVDPNILTNVTIDIGVNACSPTNAAQTSYSHITFCNSNFFDNQNPNGYLVHELIHVKQYYYGGFSFANDYTIRVIISKLKGENIYETVPAEIEASNCQFAFQNDPTIRLDSGYCNLK